MLENVNRVRGKAFDIFLEKYTNPVQKKLIFWHPSCKRRPDLNIRFEKGNNKFCTAKRLLFALKMIKLFNFYSSNISLQNFRYELQSIIKRFMARVIQFSSRKSTKI